MKSDFLYNMPEHMKNQAIKISNDFFPSDMYKEIRLDSVVLHNNLEVIGFSRIRQMGEFSSTFLTMMEGLYRAGLEPDFLNLSDYMCGTANDLYIDRIAIRRDLQGRGFGKQVLDSGISIARQIFDCGRRVFAIVNEENPSYGFFSRNGFTHLGDYSLLNPFNGRVIKHSGFCRE